MRSTVPSMRSNAPPIPTRQGLEEGGLAYPYVSLEQDVSAREGGDQQQTDGPFLTDHDPVGTCFEPQRPLSPRFNCRSSLQSPIRRKTRPGRWAPRFGNTGRRRGRQERANDSDSGRRRKAPNPTKRSAVESVPASSSARVLAVRPGSRPRRSCGVEDGLCWRGRPWPRWPGPSPACLPSPPSPIPLPDCSWASGAIGFTSLPPVGDPRPSSSNPASAEPRSTGSECSPRSRGSRSVQLRSCGLRLERARPRTAPCGPDCRRAGHAPPARERSASLPVGRALPRGLAVRLFAARKERRAVAGLVLVDATNEHQFQRLESAGVGMPMAPTGRRFVISNHWLVPSALPESLKPLAQRLALAPKAIRTLYGELGSMRHSARQVGSMHRATDAPVIVLARGVRRDAGHGRDRLDGTWLDLQRELAETMKEGSLQIVSGSGHYIHLEFRNGSSARFGRSSTGIGPAVRLSPHAVEPSRRSFIRRNDWRTGAHGGIVRPAAPRRIRSQRGIPWRSSRSRRPHPERLLRDLQWPARAGAGNERQPAVGAGSGHGDQGAGSLGHLAAVRGDPGTGGGTGGDPGRAPGFVIQMMDRKLEQLAQCMVLRIRKGAIPNPKTSVFDALPPELAEESIDIEHDHPALRRRLRGGGRGVRPQALSRAEDDGAFHVERSFGVVGQAVTGGMF